MLPINVLKEAQECFTDARNRIAEGSEHLYKISQEKLWDNGQYSGFGEFCEAGCGISASFGSKLIKVYEHYVVNGGLSPLKLGSVDSEKAYLAIDLPGHAEDQIMKADILTRQELKAQLSEDKYGEHDHQFAPERWGRCTVCKGFHQIA